MANEVFAANEVGNVKGNNNSIEKYIKLSKIRKLFKSNKKLSKFKKSPILEHIFILAFIKIRIEIKQSVFQENNF